MWRSVQRAEGARAEAAPPLLRLAGSPAPALAIAPLQDVLNLGKDARMNQPGSAEGNWRWRVTDDLLSESAFESLRELTRASSRSSGDETAVSPRSFTMSPEINA